ncbi:MAG: hypothetical protein WBX03_18525 [Terriglobales bacterium]|jgi:hypothetical protein
MRFVVEVPDQEVFEAAERPEDLAREIAEVITSEIFDFSSVAVTPERGSLERLGVLPGPHAV